jgi:hypothetical protein
MSKMPANGLGKGVVSVEECISLEDTRKNTDMVKVDDTDSVRFEEEEVRFLDV